MKLVAFDPGKTTGYCIINWHTRTEYDLVSRGLIPYENRHTEIRDIILAHQDLDVLIVEQYKIFQSKANVHINQELWGPKCISVIETVIALISPIKFQIKFLQPSVKSSVTFDVQKLKGIFEAEHDKDAFRLIKYHVLFDVF